MTFEEKLKDPKFLARRQELARKWRTYRKRAVANYTHKGNLTVKKKHKKKKFKKLKVFTPEVRSWSMIKADAAFSKFIRKRDGKCLFPACQQVEYAKLQCSHYIGRRNMAVRFDPENCITLCMYHHYMSKDLGWEFQKQRKEKHGWDGQYTIYMRLLLGEAKFEALVRRGETSMKKDKAIADCMVLISSSTKNEVVE